MDVKLIQSVPKANDVHWTKDFHKSPKVTFSTIYEFLVECQVLLKKVVYIECVLEKRDSSMFCGKKCDDDACESKGYTRTLDKAYHVEHNSSLLPMLSSWQ